MRRSIRGIILVVFLQIVSAVVWSLANPYVLCGFWWCDVYYDDFPLIVIIILGLISIGVLLSFRGSLVVVVEHYANDFLGPRGSNRASNVHGISSGIVSLIILGVIYASFFNPADALFGVIGLPTAVLTAVFIVVAVALLFSLYRTSKPFIGDITEAVASDLAPGGGRYCPNCSAQVDGEYCGNCGHKMPT